MAGMPARYMLSNAPASLGSIDTKLWCAGNLILTGSEEDMGSHIQEAQI